MRRNAVDLPTEESAQAEGAAAFRGGRPLQANPYAKMEPDPDVGLTANLIRRAFKEWNTGYTRERATALRITSGTKGKPAPKIRIPFTFDGGVAQRAAYRMGRAARRNGVPLGANPYDGRGPRSEQFRRAWAAGWRDESHAERERLGGTSIPGGDPDEDAKAGA